MCSSDLHTSGASAYVAGVAAAIQGWRISQGKPAFGPKALRELLRSGSNDRLDGMGPRVTAEGLLGI